MTVLIFILLNLLAAAVLHLEGRRKESEEFGEPFRQSYPDLSEAQRQKLRRESSHTFAASIFAQPREREMAGEFVHIDPAGFRHGGRNQTPWPPSPGDLVIFVFGGSTAFGYGVRDEDTISSYLQELLAEMLPDTSVAVYNFSRGGFYSTQERILFDELLTLGVVPNIAIFIDGLNEFSLVDEPPTFTAYMTFAAREDIAHPLFSVIRQLPLTRLLSRSNTELRFADYVKANVAPLENIPESELVADLIARYRANAKIIRALADAYGVSVAFVWQPIPVYGYDLTFHSAWKGAIGKRHRRGYERLRAGLDAEGESELIWCAEIQRDRQELLYVDQVHYNPKMSRVLAGCIADGLRSDGVLERAAEGQRSSLVRLLRNANEAADAAVTNDVRSLPGGSYGETCRDCSFDGTTLRCSCSDRAGRSAASSNSCPAGYANEDGQLVCE